MNANNGNLGRNERLISLGIGAFLAASAVRSGGMFMRTISTIGAAGFMARAVAGHCAMKAALTGKSSLREGFSEQWRHMTGGMRGNGTHVAAAEASASEKPVREQAQPAGESAGWMSHQNGRVTGSGTTPGAGDSEAGTTAVRSG